jgi:hypothetical protein
MIRIVMIAALLLVSQSTAALASTACAGADLALVSAAVTGVSSDGTLNRYDFSGTVTNMGSSAQGADTLQFVNVYAGGVKLDAKGIPPLKPGESYKFSYASMPSRDAGNGTTKLAFQLDSSQPSSRDCHTGNNRQTVTF